MGPQWIVEDVVNRTFLKTLMQTIRQFRRKKQRDVPDSAKPTPDARDKPHEKPGAATARD